jgi:hypothetical protein
VLAATNQPDVLDKALLSACSEKVVGNSLFCWSEAQRLGVLDDAEHICAAFRCTPSEHSSIPEKVS